MLRRYLARLLMVTTLPSPLIIQPALSQALLKDMIWDTWIQHPTAWINYPVSTTESVSYPRLNYGLISELRQRNHQIDLRMLGTERWININDSISGQLGIPAAHTASKMTPLQHNSPVIFATYNPDTATGRIVIQKLEKSPKGTYGLWMADFTPHHGEQWRAQRKYLNETEQANPYRSGYNPFQSFRNDITDPRFVQCSWSCFQVAVGHAMRHQNAPIAWISVAEPRLSQNTHSSGNLFVKRVTTVLDGYAKPHWFLATPTELQPNGSIAQICVITIGDGQQCDHAQHIASAGVSIEEWSGGNMPNMEDHVYHHETTKSGWSVLTYAAITFAVAWATGMMIGPQMASSFLSNLATVGSSVLQGSSLAAATLSIGYMAISTVLAHGGPITQVQANYLGKTGNGILIPQDQSEYIRALSNTIEQQHTTPQPHEGLSSSQYFIKGNCPLNWDNQQCTDNGLNPGNTWRPDQLKSYNAIRVAQQAYEYCQQRGYSGNPLNQCAAPKSGLFSTGDPSTSQP